MIFEDKFTLYFGMVFSGFVFLLFFFKFLRKWIKNYIKEIEKIKEQDDILPSAEEEVEDE